MSKILTKGEELKYFKKLAADIEKLPLAKRKEYVKKLGKTRRGISRITLIGEYFVLKTEYSKFSQKLQQNEKEWYVYKEATSFIKRSLAKVYFVTANYDCLIMERVRLTIAKTSLKYALKKRNSIKNHLKQYDVCWYDCSLQIGKSYKDVPKIYDYGCPHNGSNIIRRIEYQSCKQSGSVPF